MRRIGFLVPSILAIALTATGCGGGGNSSSPPTTGSGSGSASGSLGTSGQIDASISGHHSFMETREETSPVTGTLVETASLDWTVTISGSLQGIEDGTVVPKVTMMTGSVSQQGSGASSPISCTGSLSAAPNLPQSDLDNLLSVYPPGDKNIALHGEIGVGPLNNAGSKDYLLEGTLPVIEGDGGSDYVVSSGGCGTGGITYYYPQPQGSSEYTAWTKVWDPFADFSVGGQSSDGSESFHWSGPVSSPPGYTTTVTETDSETFSMGCSVPLTSWAASTDTDIGSAAVASSPTGNTPNIELTAAEAAPASSPFRVTAAFLYDCAKGIYVQGVAERPVAAYGDMSAEITDSAGTTGISAAGNLSYGRCFQFPFRSISGGAEKLFKAGTANLKITSNEGGTETTYPLSVMVSAKASPLLSQLPRLPSYCNYQQ